MRKALKTVVFVLYVLFNRVVDGNDLQTYVLKCPKCDCFRSEGLLYADCRNRSLTDVPDVPDEVNVLWLNGNYMKGMKNQSFSRFINLTSLDISFNDMNILYDYDFEDLKNVEHLNISNCNIYHIHQHTFRPLRNLMTLNISQNPCLGLKGIENATYGLRNSERIQLLSINEAVDRFTSCVNVGDFFFENLQNTSLVELHLDNNRIETFSPTGFRKLPHSLRKISIKRNKFTYGYYLAHLADLEGLKEIDLSGERRAVLPPFNSTAQCRNIYHVSCSCPNPTMKTDDEYLTQDLEILLPPNLKTVILKFLHLSFVIYEMHFPNNSLQHVDLSFNLLSTWTGPVYGLESLVYLNLSNNNADTVSPFFFQTFQSLKHLDISSNILYIVLENDTKGELFQGLHNLTKLDLSENIISRLPPTIFKGLSSLKVLNLSFNNLHEFNSNVYHMEDLHTIDCANNYIRWIRLPIREQLDKLSDHHNVTMNLSMNAFDCTCENIQFLAWVKYSKVYFGEGRNYRCIYNSGKVSPIVHIDDILHDLRIRCLNHFGMYLGTSLAVILILSVMICSIGYRFRWKLRYWYYAARLRYRATHDRDTAEFEYDAFISFADEDRDFVVSELVEKLENEAGLKLNIHQRDFTAGRPIASNIIEAVKNSRKTLLIFSEHFIQSYWCIYELQMANMESVTTGRDVILVLRLGQVPTKDIPTEILYQFQTDSYTEYPDNEDKSLFWRTLVSSLKI